MNNNNRLWSLLILLLLSFGVAEKLTLRGGVRGGVRGGGVASLREIDAEILEGRLLKKKKKKKSSKKSSKDDDGMGDDAVMGDDGCRRC